MSEIVGDVEDEEAAPRAPSARASLSNIGIEVPERAARLATIEPPPPPEPLPKRLRVALGVAAIVFVVGALVQVFALAWLGLVALVAGGTAELLAHGRGLEAQPFAASSAAAAGVVALLFAGVAWIAVVHRRRQRAAPLERQGWWMRHPFLVGGGALAVALGVATVLAWDGAEHFSIATVIVLANAYYFALGGAIGSARLAHFAWGRTRAWGTATQMRAVVLTASLVAAGAIGLGLLSTGWFRGNPRIARDLDEISRADGLFSAQLRAFCIVADDLEPDLARDADVAPACDFLNDRKPVP